jgi:hypothetical protein
MNSDTKVMYLVRALKEIPGNSLAPLHSVGLMKVFGWKIIDGTVFHHCTFRTSKGGVRLRQYQTEPKKSVRGI